MFHIVDLTFRQTYDVQKKYHNQTTVTLATKSAKTLRSPKYQIGNKKTLRNIYSMKPMEYSKCLLQFRYLSQATVGTASMMKIWFWRRQHSAPATTTFGSIQAQLVTVFQLLRASKRRKVDDIASIEEKKNKFK